MVPSMPGLNEKFAPRFESSTDSEELERFFSRLEELFDKSAVTMDAEKKKYAVIYTNIKTEKQWKVLEHYMKGTFEEFRKDILSSLIQERSDYMSFKREFQVLAAVLKSEDLRLERLNPPAGKTSRDPANPYTLEEVMASGLDMLQGVFSSMDRKQDEACGLDTAASSTRELHGVRASNRSNASVDEAAVKQEDVGGILASMKDIFEQQAQQAQQEQQCIAGLEKAFVKQQKMIMSFLQQQQQQIQAQQYNPYNMHPAQLGFSSAPRQMNAGESLLNRLECWFCGENRHMNADYSNSARKGVSS
ncbi:hypothetical protein ARMGADRAFT_1028985 [Armillaria gallica]|uniref:Uncharacterized protein n=1 Tax=Armillaria gallica TaxID=47427 RepID=A0A2H3DSZ0_ARMGA|nr:hypothetical protein ARMGADRAFT_1028985 [Armillaria gallica]